MSVLLQEGDASENGLGQPGKLFIYAADDKAALLEQLDAASFALETSVSNKEASFKAALYVKDEDQFEIAKTTLRSAIEADNAIDDGRSFYSPEPLYQQGKLAFVYPGSGNHFYGMGQELGIAFPRVLEQLNRENEQLASQFAHGRFWQADDGSELTHEEVIFGQVWLGTFVSDVVSSFAVKPDAVIGYSLGETAGFFSTRTWTARDEMLTRIQNSKLFTEELAGACTSVQRAWNTDEPVQWALGVINTSAEAVKEVLEDFSRVYLLIVNTPNECVIGGDQKQLQVAVAKLNAQYHPLSGVTTVHCEVAKPVQQSYRDLHIFETRPPEGVTFY
ncbi:MAG: acyltransferase domain-containing protein, partial [Gammaproteobacteria bacterium]